MSYANDGFVLASTAGWSGRIYFLLAWQYLYWLHTRNIVSGSVVFPVDGTLDGLVYDEFVCVISILTKVVVWVLLSLPMWWLVSVSVFVALLLSISSISRPDVKLVKAPFLRWTVNIQSILTLSNLPSNLIVTGFRRTLTILLGLAFLSRCFFDVS